MSAPYTTAENVLAAVPAEIRDELLDDHGSGLPDPAKWALVEQSVRDEIDGYLARRYTLPLPGPQPPVLVRSAALVLAAELLYHRRGYADDSNPWASRAKMVRAKLEAVATGADSLPLDSVRKPSGTVISEPSRTHSDNLLT